MSRTADRSAQGEALSRAVWSVLAGQGLERLTVRAVAAAAGCTTGLVMHRFPNRQALLLHARWLWITVATLVSHLSLFLVLLLSLRFAGVDAQEAGWIQVLTVFSFVIIAMFGFGVVGALREPHE